MDRGASFYHTFEMMSEQSPFGQSLLSSSDLFAQVIAASHDCIKIIALDGALREMSLPGRAAMEIDDFAALCGHAWETLWPEESRVAIAQALDKARQGQRSVIEAFCPTAKGTPKWWQVSVAPIRDANGAVVAILASSRDTSAQRQQLERLGQSLEAREAQLAQVSEELMRESARLNDLRRQLSHSEKVKLLGEFVGHIVHDMNNVLGVLASSFRMVRRKARDTVPEDLFSHGEEAIERGTCVVRQLLDFVRGGEDLPEECDVGSLILGWRDMLEHLVGPGISLELSIEPGLPQLMTRASALQSVLFNLVANARDALPGGGRVKIDASLVHSAVRGDKLRVTVEDDGVGMPAHVLARAGEPFYSTKAAGKGTGLGLASAFEFARSSHGRVEIESIPGEGTCVALLLPLARTSEARGAPEEAIDPRLHGGAELLLVEPDANLRAFVADSLRSLGYTVIVAGSAAMGVALAKAHPQVNVLLSSAGEAASVAASLRSTRGAATAITWGEAAQAADLPLPLNLAVLTTRLLEELGRLPGRRLPSIAIPVAERLAESTLQGMARTALVRWIERARSTGRLPTPEDFAGPVSEAREVFLAEVTQAGGRALFRYLSMSLPLQTRLGRPPDAKHFTGEADEGLGSLALAYLHCAAGLPYFDFAQAGGGDFSFERLVLPLSADGLTVTHLAGFIHLPAMPGTEPAPAR